MDVGAKSVAGDGGREVQEGEGGIRDGPGEFQIRVKDVGEVDELFKLLVGLPSSTDAVIKVVEEEVRDGASVPAEQELFHISYEEAGIAWTYKLSVHGEYEMLESGELKVSEKVEGMSYVPNVWWEVRGAEGKEWSQGYFGMLLIHSEVIFWCCIVVVDVPKIR
eukprot:g35883.t1